MRNHLKIMSLLIAFLLLVASPLTSVAQSLTPEEAFFAGNVAFKEQRWEDALTHYLTAYQAHTSAALELNLGHVYHKLEQPGNAFVHWRRAHLLQPQNPDIQHNLSILHSITGVIPFPPRWGVAFVPSLSAGIYVLIASLAGWMALGLWVLPRIIRKENIITRLASFVACAVAVVTAAAAFAMWPDPKLAIILSDETPLRIAPTAESPAQTKLTSGAHVRFMERHHNYWHIRTVDNQTGYVTDNEVEPVIPHQ